MKIKPSLKGLINWKACHEFQQENRDQMLEMHECASSFMLKFSWCETILESYLGMFYPGIVAVFLFQIKPLKNADEWIWVIVGDLPPAYIAAEECTSPATALDGYVGEMCEWVQAVQEGRSIEGIIPVNVPPTVENSQRLKTRLNFLSEKILSNYGDELNS